MKTLLRDVLQLLDTGDVLWLLFLAAVLHVVGRHSLELHPSSREWPRRMAVLAFLAYGLFAVAKHGLGDAETLAGVGVRAVVVAFLIASGTAIVLPLIAWLWQQSITKPRLRMETWRRQAAEESSRRQQERQRLQEQQDQNRSAPDREHAQREAEERRRTEQRNSESNRQRRENARLRCLMLYDRHATELESRFSRERLESYFATYLTDQHPPEAVEERAKLLEQLIEESAAGTSKKHAFQTLDDIAAYFRARAAEIQSLPYDDDVRDTLLTLLNKQEEDTIRRFLTP